ncbi:TetR/AcrR family transcriptional regulator [Fictibacillus sp. 26RED30]|uniref:TetR/AcrR family transcriptional regulator n=1 Tax=Fictibacillus sp. 26RED30 TaxID=2745877 RepID=UPI0018CCF46B|nr:TetR/AcrR family transcriptional regulator [Fictibacillus sp. 26RED30]MBH0162181.1 TetR/AcrR family transcriptional regulator [Fictibacillus sp. 26RED30]
MPLSHKQLKAMEQKREKILEQAILLFAEQGYESTTIAKVAKAAGVSFGSVFTYFENKDQLFFHAVTEPLEKQYREAMLDFNPEAEDLLTEIKSMIDKHITIFIEMRTYLQLVVQVIGQHTKFPEPFKVLDEFSLEFILKLQEIIRNGQKSGILEESDEDLTATAYLGFLLGIRLTFTDYAVSRVREKFKIPAFQLLYPKR